MTSRRLSGHPIGVEYERYAASMNYMEQVRRYTQCLYHYVLTCSETGPFSQQVTIDHEMLSDDILLNIFRHYLDATPQLWPMLTHVCRSWRQIVLRSPLGLHLRLYCTYGTPVLKTLDCWPPFLSS